MATRIILGTFSVVAAFTLVAVFGWKALLSGFMLIIASAFFFSKRFSIAWGVLVILAIGQFLNPAIDGGRESILRGRCHSNLHTIGHGIFDYENELGTLPPPFSVDSSGAPLHSWRVLILPYIGERDLYEQIDLDVPWDHEFNKPFHNKMPDVFCCGAVQYHSKWHTKGNSTNYVAIVDSQSCWTAAGRKFSEIVDDPSSTVLVLESESNRVPWMAPIDPTLDRLRSLADFDTPHTYGHCFSMGGNVQLIDFSNYANAEIPKFFRIDDGPPVVAE